MRACAKIILFGEHSVVYGHKAIAAPVIALGTKIDARRADVFSIDTDLSLTELEKKEAIDAVKKVSILLKVNTKSKLKVSSDIPIGAGLGSSASFCVALVRAVATINSIALTEKKTADIANECEKIFHGTPSGLDTAVISEENPLLFTKGHFPKKIEISPFKLVIADTGMKGSTSELVSQVRERYLKDRIKFEDIFSKMGGIAEDAIPVLKSGNLSALGRLMDENHELLCKIGVSTERIERLISRAKDAGAYGAKLSGAGGGGCIIFVARDVTKVADALKGYSSYVFITEIRNRGEDL